MELDDLKQTWKQSSEQLPLSNRNIMELIQNKSYGPVALLKRRFKKQLVILPLVVLLLINVLSKKHDIFSDVLFWVYIGICLATCSYFYFSYRLLSKMERMDDMVKPMLEKQVQLLEKGSAWRLTAVRIAFTFFIILLEILMYFQQEPSLAKWHSQPLGLRLLCYAGLLAAFYFFSKFVFSYKYGKHIAYLKNLVQQMQ